MKRVFAYVDGFNLYFGLRDSKLKRLYWLDVAALAKSLLLPEQQLLHTRYFTTRIRGLGNNVDDVRRQATYIDALLARPDISVQEGHYLEKKMECRNCGAVWTKFEEKMTDVNIAVALISDAAQDRFDTAFVLSGDSDLTTPVRQVVTQFPQKRVVVAFPPLRHSSALARVASTSFMIGEAKLRRSQLPEVVTTSSGVQLRRPVQWR